MKKTERDLPPRKGKRAAVFTIRSGSGPGAAMVVRDARAEIIRAPLITPFRIATGQHDFLENVFLRLELEDGAVGWGEAGVATHISGETLSGTLANLQKTADAMVGCALGDYRGCCSGFKSTFKTNPAGLAALEMAVLDAVARSCRFPFWRFFGPRPVRFATDITIVIGSVHEASAMTRRFFRRGFDSFKIKIGGDEALDHARICAVARQAPNAALLLDGNQGYDAPRMMDFLKSLRRAGIRPRLLEQPVPRADWEGLARLTRDSGILVCADESVRTLADAVLAVKNRAVQAVNVKFAKCGVLEATEIARFVRAAGLKLMIGAMLESALSISAAAHFAAGFGGFGFVDLDTTYFIRGPLAKTPGLDRCGRFDLNRARPGIGVTPTVGR